MTAHPFSDLLAAAQDRGVLVMGALHPAHRPVKLLDSGTLILLGAGPDFWPRFTASAEWRDTKPDPVDRWSTRVIGELADLFGATRYLPFGDPPYMPFIDWAQQSGRAHQSPTGMLVHDTVGLMISYRGALHFEAEFAIPAATAPSPCAACADKPCLTACPVGALGATQPYDLPACHAYLDTAPGQACMTQGCAVRRACPVSAGAGRSAEQSAHHMKAFHRK